MTDSQLKASIRDLHPRWIAVAIVVFFIAAFGNEVRAEPPQNLADFEKQLITYHDSGAYDRDLETVASQAIEYIQSNATAAKNPALVLDIDETSLSNWAKLLANQFGFFPTGACDLPKGPCGEDSWEQMGIATPIWATHRIYEAARNAHVTVFFITGRQSRFRHATIQNLHDAGYTEFADVMMEDDGAHFASAADFKSVQRERIEQSGYTIIANVGDQLSDLERGHARKTFKMPNPFYFIP
jgi:acid phosphatase